MKSAIESKGVTITGGLSSYADAIDSILTDIGDVECIYVPNGISFGFRRARGENDSTTLPSLPDMIAFDITDCTEFTINVTETYFNNTAKTVYTESKKIYLVDFGS
jgi:hypothetical protein